MQAAPVHDGRAVALAQSVAVRWVCEGACRVNYYEHHLGDWAAATGHLTWDEDMAYTRLLRAYYHHERAIPDGQQYRLAKASTPGQRKAVDAVLAEFFDLRDDGWHQKRADAEIARYQDKQAKAKRSAEARWSAQRPQSERNADASPDAMRTHSEGNALQTPDTRHHPSSKAAVEAPQAARRGSRLPPDWEPGEPGMAFAASQGLTNGRATAELAKFRDFWTAKTGADATKADWQATWRNWVRRAVETAPPKGRMPADDPFAGAH